ncbi:MAG: DUF624 domain-containing protein [Clostridia bacterium]|nr:DUF624 domain-containing protein [Clostridia bacterium]
MDDFFNKNSLAMRFLTNVANMILVNIIFIIFSLPLFTIGASLCGLYKIVFSMHNGDEVFVFRDFVQEFKADFKKATIIWIPILLFSAYFAVELGYLNNFKNMPWLQIPVWIMLFFVVSILIYAFPLLASFENSLKNTLKNSILLSLGNLPTTIFIVVIYIGMYLLIDFNHVFIVILGSLALFNGCGFMAWFTALFLRRIFGLNKARNTDNEESTEPSKDNL